MQAQKTHAVTREEALVLVKNMLRISVSTICYMRDLFPTDCFKNKQYGSVDIHQLQGAKKDSNGELVVTYPEAFLVTQWLEKGVFSALEDEYISSMIFAVFCKHPLSGDDLLLESYEFKISQRSDSSGFSVNDIELFSKEAVKAQAAKLIRALTEFASTLEQLPKTRWITVQLKYNDNAPMDYEPEYFVSTSKTMLEGQTFPLVINVGSLCTPDLQMKLRFAGLESLLFEDLCKVENQTALPTEAQNKNILAASVGPNVIEERVDEEKKEDLSLLDKIKAFILETKSTAARTIAQNFNLKERETKPLLASLEKEGFLERKGRFLVVREQAGDSIDELDEATMDVEENVTTSRTVILSQCSEVSEGKTRRKFSTIKEPISLEFVANKKTKR